MNERKLQNYLMKCELQYRADHMDRASTLDWLAPHCESLEEIQRFLKEIGFRIKEVIDEMDCNGEPFRWVTTTSGVIVYVNSKDIKGLFVKAKQ